MKKPKLKKYPTGGSKGFIPDKLVHYVGQGESPYSREQLGSMGYNYETTTNGFDEYSMGDNRRFYKTVLPNTPEWSNPENPYLINNTKQAITKTVPKPKYPSYGSPEYIKTHPEYTPPSNGIVTFSKGGTKLPKFLPGGEFESSSMIEDYRDGNGNFWDGANGQESYYKSQEPIASAADQQQINNNKLNSTVSSIGGNMGWFAYANQAKDMGKSMLSKDEYGNYNSNVEKAANEIMTPDHEQMMGDIKNKRYDLALLDSTGLGKFARMGSQLTGNSQKTTGNWGKFNRMVGITKDKQKDTSAEDAYNLAEQNRKNNLYHTYAQGGVHSGMPNAEVEKEEVMRMPNGQTTQVDGPSHDNGGVPVNIPDGTQIFSDRLKDPTTKKTFAKMAEKYKVKDLDSNSTPLKKSTEELNNKIKQDKLDKIFKAQESLKALKMSKYASKLGLDPVNYTNGGTKLPQYYTGGGFGSIDPKNLQLAQQAQSGLPPMEEVEDPSFNNALYNKYQTPFIRPSEAERLKNERSNSKQQYVPNPNDPYEQAMAAGKEFEQPAKQVNPKTGNYEWIEPTVNTLVQNAGNIAYLAGEGKKYDKQDFYKYSPELYNPADALRQADIEARVNRGKLKDASGGNAGALMSNLTQSQAINTLLKSKIRTDAANQNAGTLNDAQVRNIQGKYNVDDINARNKGQALTNYYNAIRGIGQNTSGAYRDWKRGEVDQQTLDIISKNYPDYVYDKRRKGWYHKSTDKKLE